MAKMPIRNKSKDNPYTLGYSEDKKVYIVEFKDKKKKHIRLRYLGKYMMLLIDLN